MIKNNLSTIMGSKRINKAELARMSGLSYDTVLNLYNDVNVGIEFDTLDKLCWALECTPNDIPYISPIKQNNF